MLKNALYVTAAVVVISLCAGLVGLAMPSQTYHEEKVDIYNHQGVFSHTAYTVSQGAQPPAVLFPKIVDTLEIQFFYDGPVEESITESVYLIDNSGSWQKEIPVQITGTNPLSFPLDLIQLLTIGNSINTELGIRGSSYKIKIVAQVTPDFSLTLEGNLDATLLTWDESGFYRAERGFPGGETLRAAAFGYQAKLIDNTLYGATTIERKPDIPVIEELDASNSMPTEAVQSCDIGFNYAFTSSSKIDSLSKELQISMTMSETGGWQKTYELLPPTKMDQSEVTIPVDIQKLVNIADINDQSTGNRTAIDRNITIVAEVHTIDRTESGVINETFTQTLNGTIGKLLSWQDTDKAGASLLRLVKSGDIKRTVASSNTAVNILRLISLIVFVLSIVLFVYLLRRYLKRRTSPTIRDIYIEKMKKYGEIISEVSDMGALKKGDTLIHVFTLDALAKIANNSLKPVLLQMSPDELTYRVIDGTTTYQYVAKVEQIDSGKKSKDLAE